MAWAGPRVVAHRGGGALAPENTLGALRLGASRGFRGVEFDVMLAGDGTPVLIHDETLARTTNGKGDVARTPYAELAKLDAGAWKGEQWRGEPLPAFADAGRLCRSLGLWSNVEIKPAKGFERATGTAVARMAAEIWRDDPSQCLLSSFSAVALEAARDAAPHLARGYIVRPVTERLDVLERLGCVSLHCKHQVLEEAQVREVRDAGYALLCWTVNEPEIARRLLGWGVDGVITDALDRIGPGFA